MLRKLEDYFDYYWAKDLNYAMKSEEGERFISELPKEIKVGVSQILYTNKEFRVFKTYINLDPLNTYIDLQGLSLS